MTWLTGLGTRNSALWSVGCSQGQTVAIPWISLKFESLLGHDCGRHSRVWWRQHVEFIIGSLWLGHLATMSVMGQTCLQMPKLRWRAMPCNITGQTRSSQNFISNTTRKTKDGRKKRKTTTPTPPPAGKGEGSRVSNTALRSTFSCLVFTHRQHNSYRKFRWLFIWAVSILHGATRQWARGARSPSESSNMMDGLRIWWRVWWRYSSYRSWTGSLGGESVNKGNWTSYNNLTLQEPSLYHRIQVDLLLMTAFRDNVGEEPREKIAIGHVLFCSLAKSENRKQYRILWVIWNMLSTVGIIPPSRRCWRGYRGNWFTIHIFGSPAHTTRSDQRQVAPLNTSSFEFPSNTGYRPTDQVTNGTALSSVSPHV